MDFALASGTTSKVTRSMRGNDAHPDGRHGIVAVEPLAEGATSIWKSAATGRRYRTHWVVSIPMLKARLRVEPFVREQEVGSPMGEHRYEGASSVVGQMEGEPATGHAIVELVGDRN